MKEIQEVHSLSRGSTGASSWPESSAGELDVETGTGQGFTHVFQNSDLGSRKTQIMKIVIDKILLLLKMFPKINFFCPSGSFSLTSSEIKTS